MYDEKLNEILESNMITIGKIYIKIKRLIMQIIFFSKHSQTYKSDIKYCGFYMDSSLQNTPYDEHKHVLTTNLWNKLR